VFLIRRSRGQPYPPPPPPPPHTHTYLTLLPHGRRMGQPIQRATNYSARSNIEPAQIFLHANGQSAPQSTHIHTSSPHRQHSLNTSHTHAAASMKRPTEHFVAYLLPYLQALLQAYHARLAHRIRVNNGYLHVFPILRIRDPPCPPPPTRLKVLCTPK